ncbi:MAG: PQQ-binding-like beta-propeller repeat protein [Planctomycetaceae bacterium]|nr:PQQ-binding-like beta-propeller repeat protein [Planctomycetaceae bacterium]
MAAEEYDDDELYDDDVEAVEEQEVREQREKGRKHLARGRMAQLGDRIAGGAARPGEQEVTRSPFVLILTGGVLGLGLLAGIFYYIIGREDEARTLKEAMTAYDQQKYAEAEQLLLNFMKVYPESPSSDKVRLTLHKSRVEKYIMTTTPDVPKGFEEFENLIRIGKDLTGFDEERDNLKRYADRLAFAGARVGEILQKQEPLDISIKSLQKLQQFYGEQGVPKDREEELIRRQRIAEAAIAKRGSYDTAVAQIKEFLEAGRTVDALASREALIRQYPVLSDDADVAKLLTEILTREQDLVVQTSVGTPASTSDDGPVARSLSLTLTSETDSVSQKRSVFGLGIDSVFALDSETGRPNWKRVIGENPAFSPVPVKGSEDGLLLHSPRTNEIAMLRQADGSLLWRQSIEGRPVGQPLIHEQQIYLTTDRGELWQFPVSDGRASVRLTFTQPVVGPPALTRDGRSLLIPGNQMMVYTLGLNPLKCTAVSYINYSPGAVQVPIVPAGDVYVLCDNNTADKCRIRVLSLEESSGRLSVRHSDVVDGVVRDPCLLRGRDLFVPSSPQRVTAFRITDDPEQTPLSRIGANQLEGGTQTRMFLLAGSGGQLWLAGRDLRKFQTRTNALLLDSGTTAEGIHLQPIQFLDEGVFLNSRRETLSSVEFTRADPESMVGIWRTVTGSNVIAVGESATGESLLALTDYGHMYRMTPDSVAQGGFATETVSEFRLPDKLASAIDGLRLQDGRLAAWAGDDEPAVWTFSPTGQFERKWPLAAAPETNGVTISAGLVLGLPGRIHLTANSSGASEDYRSAQNGGEQSGWKSLTALSETQVLAVDAQNQLIRVEYRDNPRPHLAEISVTKTVHSIDVAPAVGNGLLFVASAEGKLVMMQASSLEVLAEVDLGAVPAQSAFVSGDRVFINLANRELRTFAIDNGLQQCGSTDLEGSGLAGTPNRLSSGELLLARTDGTLVRLTADGLPSGEAVRLGQRLKRGPVLLNGRYFAVAIDGSFYQLPAEMTK